MVMLKNSVIPKIMTFMIILNANQSHTGTDNYLNLNNDIMITPLTHFILILPPGL